MASWTFASDEPITTERQRAVECDDGRKGWVSIRHVGGRPQPYGGVHAEADSGEPDRPNKLLDLLPTIRHAR